MTSELADTLLTEPVAVFAAGLSAITPPPPSPAEAIDRMLAACSVPPISWYFTSTGVPAVRSSVTAGFVPSAAAFRVFVPAPVAVTVVELSTVNFMS